MQVERVLETCLYVDDVEEAADFYQTVLGIELFSEDLPRHAFLVLEDQMLLLFDPDETESVDPEDRAPPHAARGSQHVAFAVDDLDVWGARLDEEGVEILATRDWGGGESVYFEDPSGNILELVERGVWPVW